MAGCPPGASGGPSNAVREHGAVDVRIEGDAFFGVFPSATDAAAATAEAQRRVTDHD